MSIFTWKNYLAFLLVSVGIVYFVLMLTFRFDIVFTAALGLVLGLSLPIKYTHTSVLNLCVFISLQTVKKMTINLQILKSK